MLIQATTLDFKQLPQADVCIVGAGAAGISLACELDGSGLSVLLIDPGQAIPKKEPSQAAYEGTSDAPHAHPSFFRRRGYGGTTGIWGGRCVPYDPVDFAARDHVPHSGWPLGYDDIARHYPAAMRYLDAGEFAFTTQGALQQASPTFPGAAPSEALLTEAIERYSLPTDFGHRYHHKLVASRNVSVLGGVQVLELLRNPDTGRIEGLVCCLSDGTKRFTLAPRQVVLATGGIETPRLLLSSDVANGGIGNQHDLVGRFYTCHLEKIHGQVRSQRPGVVFDFERTRDGVYARRKILIKDEVQHQQKLMNISFRLHYPDVSQASHKSAVLSAVYLAKRTLIPEYRRILQHSTDEAPAPSTLAHVGNVVRGLPDLVAFGVKWLRERVLAERKLPYVLVANADHSFPLEFNAEQVPLYDSRITLGQGTDEFGMRRVHVQWKKCAQDIDSIARAYRLLRCELESTGLYSVEFDDARLEQDLAEAFPVGGHHIGTARMAASPEHGVVDQDCRVFGTPNLYIASSAVFPTSSHANPTLTIVALSLRLAQHLKQSLVVPA
jgi:choline dehydrogenase-like flavoprotein